MAVTLLDYSTKTLQAGTVSIPFYTDAVAALVMGTIEPVILNGIDMTVKAAVAETEGVPAISIQFLRYPPTAELPYSYQGSEVTFVFLKDAISVRPDIIAKFSNVGSVTKNLLSSADDIVLGMVIGDNGQAEIEGDGVAFTNLVDNLLYRFGHLDPGDTSIAIEATTPNTVTGYWYQPPPVYHPEELISEGYYTYESVYHPGEWVEDPLFGQPGHPDEYVWVPAWYETVKIWHPPEYRDAYWTYPDQVWVEVGEAGKLSVCVISVANVMIGSVYTSRPLGV